MRQTEWNGHVISPRDEARDAPDIRLLEPLFKNQNPFHTCCALTGTNGGTSPWQRHISFL